MTVAVEELFTFTLAEFDQKTALSDFSFVFQVIVALTVFGLAKRLLITGAKISGAEEAVPLNFLLIPNGTKQFQKKSLSSDPQFFI